MKQIIIKTLKKIYRILPLSMKHKKRIKTFFIKEKSINNLSKNNFFNQIKKYEIVSFDIFDTLISRMLYDPDDLFDIMDEILRKKDKLKVSFKEMRKNAEQKAREELKKDCTLDEIYCFMSKYYNLSKKKEEEYKKLEIDLEVNLCIPRKDMLEVFNQLKKKNKTIILTSDMYLPKHVIEDMLKKCGYSGYKHFFLSNEENKRKDTKEIWKAVLKKYPHQKIVHIGDNENSDVIYPKHFAINTLKIKSGKELLDDSEVKIYLDEIIYNRKPSDSVQLGIIINKILFNSPFSNGKINTLEDFSYSYIAPLMLSLMEFIQEKANNKDQILFLAREGYNLQKLYQDYCAIFGVKEIKNAYFLASRRAVTNATIDTEKDLELLCQKIFEGKIKKFFEEVLGISYQEEDFEIKLPRDYNLVIKKVKKYKKQIFAKTELHKKNYLNYVNQNIKNYQKKDLCLVDLGYSGTIQYYLTKMLEQEVEGIYLTNSDTVKRYTKKSKLNFCFDITAKEKYKKIYYYSLVLEFFLSAPTGQLIGFENVGDKVEAIYNNEVMDEEKKKNIKKIYDSVLEFFKDIKEIQEIYELELNKDLIFQNYIGIIETKVLSYEVKDLFRFIDAYNEIAEYNVFERIGQY